MTVSLPAPQVSTSPTSPRDTSVSSPAPPSSVSTPWLPISVSAPLPPVTWSLPAPPEIRDGVAVELVTVSLPSPTSTMISATLVASQVTVFAPPVQPAPGVIVAPLSERVRPPAPAVMLRALTSPGAAV